MIERKFITIIQRRLTHYRVPFFLALRESLDMAGYSLRLLHGEGTSQEAAKRDSGHIEWAEKLHTTYLARGRLCWQPFSRQVAGSSLVIIPQENAMLANHLALIRKPQGKLAFWGHGGNFQGNARSISERYKRWSTRRSDWYFGYTSLSVDLVTAAGFPRSQTTQLNNAIDISELKRDLSRVDSRDIAEFRAKCGLGDGPIALYLGSLYKHKRLDVLIAAAIRLRAVIDNFQLLIVGDGPQRAEIEVASARHPWIRYVGARKGRDKACALKSAAIVMNPGLVGLGILDSFAGGVPMVTTDCGLHSPEIAYLASDNGVMTPNNLEDFVAACGYLLANETERERLAFGCCTAASHYTLPNMVANFTMGVLQALENSR